MQSITPTTRGTASSEYTAPKRGTADIHYRSAAVRHDFSPPAPGTNQVPRVWQTIYPYPDLTRPTGTDRRRQRVDRQLLFFSFLSPEFRRMHPIDADSPQECSEITSHVFTSLRFDTTYTVPNYRNWLDKNGHVDAYRFHKRFLQHLQYQAHRRVRWVLKCPDHIFALEAIRFVYPDARLVWRSELLYKMCQQAVRGSPTTGRVR